MELFTVNCLHDHLNNIVIGLLFSVHVNMLSVTKKTTWCCNLLRVYVTKIHWDQYIPSFTLQTWLFGFTPHKNTGILGDGPVFGWAACQPRPPTTGILYDKYSHAVAFPKNLMGRIITCTQTWALAYLLHAICKSKVLWFAHRLNGLGSLRTHCRHQ